MQYQIAWDGGVEVNDGSGWFRPSLPANVRQMFTEKVLIPWGPAASRVSRKTGIPAIWLLAMIWRESHGNPLAEGPPSDHGYGLMMLTHSSYFRGHDPEETLRDPELNIYLGALGLQKIRALVGDDFPKAASMFNAGYAGSGPYPSSVSPWGYREAPGHITEEVQALNDALAIGWSSGASPAVGVLLFAACAVGAFWATRRYAGPELLRV